jgi:hypothetical protein
MRSDIIPGARFPDYELTDHTRTRRLLSELQGNDPMILILSRGHYYPKDLQQKKLCNDDASIENKVSKTITNNTSIELPQEIKALITGNEYWVNAKSNRYKKLIREGHLDKLLELARMAHSKNNPANWFAKACSKAAWERTLAYFAKLAEIARKAETVERWAIAAEEISHDKPGQSRERYFAWLCVNEKRL